MTCKEIQRSLFGWCVQKRHVFVLPNFYLGYECDLISVTAAKLVYEYEIKVSVADFRADARKTEKHGVYRGEFPCASKGTIPNFFFYVVPQELRDAVEPLLPPHAGLCVVLNMISLPQVVIKAPKLHGEPMPEPVFTRAARSLMFRYWRLRETEKSEEGNDSEQ